MFPLNRNALASSALSPRIPLVILSSGESHQQDELSPVNKVAFSPLSTVATPSRRIPHSSRCSAPTRNLLSPLLVSHFGKASLGSAECAKHPVQRPAQIADLREIRATTGEKPISFRIRTYTKRGRGWGSEKSAHISPETLTLLTRLIAANVMIAANGGVKAPDDFFDAAKLLMSMTFAARGEEKRVARGAGFGQTISC
jgi:hypothetical protein